MERSPLSLAFPNLVLVLALTLCYSPTSASPQNQTSQYSHFDLFKNTALQPCPINSNISSDPTGSEFIYWGSAKAKSPSDYCTWMAGTPIVIPTSPTRAAFYPGWPAFATQALTLLFTYLGLWKTLRTLNKHKEKQDMSLGSTFWIQVPIDVARIIAWYVSFFRGFADLARFPWISVLLWTVPFNYIWLFTLLQEGLEDHTQVNLQPRRTATRVRILVGVAVVVTVVQWAFSLAGIIIHYKYNWPGLRARLYTELPAAIADPSSLGPMPQQCLDYITSNTLPNEIFSSSAAQTAFIAQAVQFAVTTLVILTGVKRVLHNNYRRTYTMLRNSAAATQASLNFSALGLLGYVFSINDVDVYATNDQSITGPCTFAVVHMWNLWGFYDVEYGRAWRLFLNVLGV